MTKFNENVWTAIKDALESAWSFFDWMAEEADGLLEELSFTDAPAMTTAKAEKLCEKYNFSSFNGVTCALKGMHNVAMPAMAKIGQELDKVKAGNIYTDRDMERALEVLRFAHKEGGMPLVKKWDKIEIPFGGVVEMIW